MMSNSCYTIDSGTNFPNFKLNEKDKENISAFRQLIHSTLPTESIVNGELIKKENYYPLPALQEFINNDFKTAEELKHKEQSRIQNSSLNWTKRVAITSIILSFITILLTIYNNTQPSERNVTLKNPIDTIKVINITPVTPILKDTGKVDSILK